MMPALMLFRQQCTDSLSVSVVPQVYLRIKEAMELAEEARLERDAARTETDSLKLQLAATQVGICTKVVRRAAACMLSTYNMR